MSNEVRKPDALHSAANLEEKPDGSSQAESALKHAARRAAEKLQRRREKRMPRWYRPKQEDPARMHLDAHLDQTLLEYDAKQKDPVHNASLSSIVRPLSRREIEIPQFSMSPLMMPQEEDTQASFLRTVSRFIIWTLGIIRFQLGVLVDKLLRRDSQERRAQRLLRIISRIGGTLIKFGQQLAMRVDLLPYPYCVELSKLLDRMPSFPLKEAVAAIQRATGKPLKEVFAQFDPEPIGSASVACVYQAVLLTGEKVAVKVRRPGIGRIFAADLRAMSWIVGILEWLAIIRPGSMSNAVRDLETAFLEELNLRREAYFQEVFRRNSQSREFTRRFYFSAPRVFFEYTSNEVIVQDFVSGMWLWEILRGVEQGSESALTRMRELNIDPKVVARRLYWIGMWGNLSNVLFHADPHPANVIVQADNHIIFIDFGACGFLAGDKRNRFLDFFRCQAARDISGMVKATMALLEPLPPIDLDAFQRDLERRFFLIAISLWSKQGRWWERTSATLWLSLMQLTRQYKLPINPDTVKGLRATLLYDTMSLRLDHEMDLIKESQNFMRDWRAVNGKRLRRRLRKRIRRGIRISDYSTLHDMLNVGGRAFEHVKRMLDHPGFNFSYNIDKWVHTFITVAQVAMFLLCMLAVGTGSSAVVLILKAKPISLSSLMHEVLSHRAFLTLGGLATVVGVRRIMFRLRDQDV